VYLKRYPVEQAKLQAFQHCKQKYYSKYYQNRFYSKKELLGKKNNNAKMQLMQISHAENKTENSYLSSTV